MLHKSFRLFAVVSGLSFALASMAFAQSAVAPVKNGAAQVGITLTASNGGTCALDYNAAKAGPVTFSITNQTATAINEVELLSDHRILGEKENLAPGLPTVSFTVTLGGGDYQIYCPGAAQKLQSFTVTGKAKQATGDIAELLKKGTQGYAHYVDGMVNAMVTAVGRLQKDIDAGNLEQARIEYPKARVFYERIESDVEGFVLPGYKITDNAGSLDYLIDMRASSLDPRIGWHGFHAIERDLFKFDKIDQGTKQLAAELLKNVKRLQTVAATLTYRPEDLANGAADLLEEVLSSKITGEEEAFSHYDLVDFAGNVEGAQQAFAFLKPAMKKIDPALTKQITQRFKAVNDMLEQFRDPNMPGGFVLYTAKIKKPTRSNSVAPFKPCRSRCPASRKKWPRQAFNHERQRPSRYIPSVAPTIAARHGSGLCGRAAGTQSGFRRASPVRRRDDRLVQAAPVLRQWATGWYRNPAATLRGVHDLQPDHSKTSGVANTAGAVVGGHCPDGTGKTNWSG